MDRWAIRLDTYGNIALRRPETLSGGDGLVSCAGDYHRFARRLAWGGEPRSRGGCGWCMPALRAARRQGSRGAAGPLRLTYAARVP